jgi:MYXO-CTERM domain-containing protein
MRPQTLALIAAMVCAPAAAAAKYYRYPLDGDKGTVSAYFDHAGKDWSCGTKRYSGHNGSDFAAPKGTPVYAGAAATVDYINDGCTDTCTTGSCGCGGGYGNYVRLKHPSGHLSYYAHLQIWSIKVKLGQSVTCGQHIGNVASSGNSTGNHLHFEVRVGATTKTDPFVGNCHGGSTFWVQQGPYKGRPGTTCTGPPPKQDSAPPPPPPKDSAPPPSKDSGQPKLDTGLPPPTTDGFSGEMPPPWTGAQGGQTLTGGCSTGLPGGLGGLGWLVLLGLVLLWRRRWR